MSVLLGLIFLAILLTVFVLRSRKSVPVAEKKPLSIKVGPLWKGIFAHPGHSWVDVIHPDLVNIGMDKFTKSVFGSINKLKLPKKGTMIHQGERVWTLKSEKRELTQVSPISGKVIEVNQELLENPKVVTEKNVEKSWILKVEPTLLKRELRNLLHGDTIARWNQAVKEHLIATLTSAKFPVLQEGGEIKPDLGDELTPRQWEKVTREFFETGKSK